jgi:RimJ/RimL family protein N-acetyltransferase
VRTPTQAGRAATYDEVVETVVLPSGDRLVIRPIRRDDGERLRASHARLSPDTRYRRFLAPKPTLTTGDARYLTDLDAHDHLALVVLPAGDPERIVAVARYIRLPADPQAAEFAIVVGDAYQRSGLGSILLSRLAREGLAHGVERFVGSMLAENAGAHRLVQRVTPAPARWRHHGAVDEVEFTLAADPVLLAA